MNNFKRKYNDFRKKHSPASKEDISWRHEQIIAVIELLRNSLNKENIIKNIEMLREQMDSFSSRLDEIQQINVVKVESDSSVEFNSIVQANLEDRLIILDYPLIPNHPKYYHKTLAGKKIISILENAKESSFFALKEIKKYLSNFEDIKFDDPLNVTDPYWNNDMFTGLDAMYLYAQIRLRKPKIYFEIGSGNSTKFARQAIIDGGFDTKIISIDPHPRADINSICDEIIRHPLEIVDVDEYLSELSEGDIFFIDSSHRSFAGNDVTAFFTEILPALPNGVLYGIHDIFLPYDYPSNFANRYYNEQYLLASYILGGHNKDRIVFPGAFVSSSRIFKPDIMELFPTPNLTKVLKEGCAFWMER